MNYHISSTWVVILSILAVWELIWKGFALWRASQKKQWIWFIAILVINSVGLIPIIYLIATNGADHGDH